MSRRARYVALLLPLVPLFLWAVPRGIAQGAGKTEAQGLDVAGMNRSVAPGDDFFAFANGAWIAKTEIPADRDAYGTFSIIHETTEKRTHALVQNAGSAAAGTEKRKVGDYYAAFMDEKAIDAAGLKPVQPTLDRIAAIKDRAALARYLGSTLRADIDLFNATDVYTENVLGLWVAQDLDQPTRYAAFLAQGGLGLPDRDYYLDDSAEMKTICEKYEAHVAKMLTLAKVAEPAATAAKIVALERQIARTHASRQDTGDVKKGHNRWKRDDFARRAPGLDWNAYFDAAGLGKRGEFIVWQPSAVTGLAALAAKEPLDTWKQYLAFHAIAQNAAVLPRAFDQESFDFHGRTVRGVPEQRARWKRALDATSEALGDAVGKLYVEKWFPASEKARAEAMVKNLITAFGQRVDRLAWMAPETKAKAKDKLKILKVGVGYPDKWREYAGLEVKAGDAFGNAERASLFEYRYRIAQLDRPVDRGEWVMTAQTVNAVNLPAMNAMNFPAAILQPPFFDPNRPSSMDYGSIGAIIGHEISHSFDDQGAQFDATGKLANWWTEKDLATFKAASDKLVAQYSAYEPFPGVHINGELTLGENIADLAGLATAYDGWKLSLGGKPAPAVAGFTGDQQFFIAFAQGWRTKMRDEALKQRLIIDSHTPAPWRAATVRNVDEWYKAFDVKPGQKLFLAPEQRIRMW